MQECFDHQCLIRQACQLYILHRPDRVVLLSYEATLRGCKYFTPIKSLRMVSSGRKRQKHVKLKAKGYDNSSAQNKVFIST